MIKFTRILILMLIVLAVSCGSEEEFDYGILRAVPTNAGVIVKASDICELCDALNSENQIWAQLKTLPRCKSAANIINTIDTIAKNRGNIRALLKGRDAMVSFHREGSDKVYALVGIDITAKDAKLLWQNMLDIAKKRKLTIEPYDYDRERGQVVYDTKKKPLFYIVYMDGLLLTSTNELTIQRAVRHIHSNSGSMANDKTLLPLLKWAGAKVSAVLIFNHKHLSNMFGGDLSAATAKTVASHAGWSVLDISLKKQLVSCAGYTDGSQASHRLSVIKSQQPVKNRCAEYLPSKTTAFVSLGISDMHLFENDYINHLKSIGMFSEHQKADASINKDYGIDFANTLYDNIAGRITEFSCTYSLAGRGNDHYIVAELYNADEFERRMALVCKKYRQKNNVADKDGLFKFTTSAGNTYRVYLYPLRNTFHRYFGDIFSAEAYYFMIYKDLAVFGRAVDALYEYANNIDNGKILANNSIYDSFVTNVNTESNLYYYIDLSFAQEDVRKWLSTTNASEWTQNLANMQSLRSCAIQYSHREGGIFYTNSALMHSNTIEADRYVSWLAQTDTCVCSKPQVLNKHYTSEKEVFVQDETNKLYLFDKSGKKQFAKQLGEPMTSQIFQIDLYGNSKKQYLFATENFLHAIDRNGNYLDNFPVQLPARVSAEISVFDYDNTLDYRIFVPCSDNYLYVYTKEGKPLDTWTPLHTNYPLITPVQYFRIGDIDYLVSADNLKTYILNRRGEMRINVTNSFPKAKNSLYYVENPGTSDMRFITSNSSGEIKYIYTDGSCKSKSFRTFTADHYFVLSDIDGDGNSEYIFTDAEMLYVYRADGSEVFSYCCDGSLGRPNIFKFANNDVRIGVTSRPLGKIFLFDSKGKICSGFPLQGSSEFSIVKLNSTSKYSVLVGNSDNYLYNYFIY
jgi:hypothetical protein